MPSRFWGAVTEGEATGPFVLTNDVRFTTRGFHFLQRPKCIRIAFELGLYFCPCDSDMPAHVLLEASLQYLEQLFAVSRLHGLRNLLTIDCRSVVLLVTHNVDLCLLAHRDREVQGSMV